MTGSGFAIAESIVFILMLFCPRSVIFCRSDRPRPIDAGLKTVRTNPLRNTTRKRATKPCLFCPPHPFGGAAFITGIVIAAASLFGG